MAEPARKPNAAETRIEKQSRRGLLSVGSGDGGARRRQKPRGPIRGTVQGRRQSAALLRTVVSQGRAAEALPIHGQEVAQSVSMRAEVQLHVRVGQGSGQTPPPAPELLPFVPGVGSGRGDVDVRLYTRAQWL